MTNSDGADKFGDTSKQRLVALTRKYEKRLAAQTMADQPLCQLIDDVVATQNEYIVELEARIKKLEGEVEIAKGFHDVAVAERNHERHLALRAVARIKELEAERGEEG